MVGVKMGMIGAMSKVRTSKGLRVIIVSGGRVAIDRMVRFE